MSNLRLPRPDRRTRAVRVRAPLPFVLTALLVAGCGGDATTAEVDDPLCPGDPDNVQAAGYWFGLEECKDGDLCSYPVTDTGRGSNANYVPDFRLVTMGPEDGPDSEPQGNLLLVFEEPSTPSGTAGCSAGIQDAVLSTSEQSVGTVDEINPKHYEYLCLLEPCGDGEGGIEIDYISNDLISGTAYLPMQRVIYSPINPPEYGEIIHVIAKFNISS